MIVTLTRTINLIDQDRNEREFGPGEVEVEAGPNPFGHPAPWIMIKGKGYGAAAPGWKPFIGEVAVNELCGIY